MPDPDRFARHLKAYQRSRRRHKRREERYTMHGRRAYLNLSDRELRMLRQASALSDRLLEQIYDYDGDPE